MHLRHAVLVTSLSTALLHASDAGACGGCFPPPQTETQSTVVTGHRMALAVSPAHSVLWDQIKYAGSPTDFAWVLPVKGDAVLQLSNDAWFETLDASTSAQIISPQYSCSPPPSSSGFGCACGGSASAKSFALGGADGRNAPPPVTVTHEGTVGPYETVTLHANVPDALPSWLTAHGYAISPSVKPILDAYTAEGFDFIALRLLPGAGVQQMKPVRVVTSGMSATLPLRMVAAGTGPEVAVTLFVIGEGRWEAQNFPNAVLDPAALTWDFDTKSSDYSTVRSALMATNGGRTWNNAFAQQGSLLSQDTSSGQGLTITVGASSYATFAEAYVQQGVANGEATTTDCLTELAGIAGSKEQVSGDCLSQGATGPGADGGTADAGVPCSAPSGEIDASQLACGGLDDLAVALVGLHPQDVWLTRLEANLPRAALATDLLLQPSAQQTPISSVITVTNAKGNPCAPAAGAVASGSAALRNRLASVAAAVGIALAALARRRRRAAPAPAYARALAVEAT